MAEAWKLLFARAVEQLKQGGVAKKNWVFGGGTVLTHKYNHRESKDIDIFFRDPQFLNFVSPRMNDGVEASLVNYSEQAHHLRLQFKEGEIDFILGTQISKMTPPLTKVLNDYVYVEHPVEIVAKKIHYRAEEFKPRDVFDLAVVFNAQRECMLQNAGAFAEKLPILMERIDALEDSGKLEMGLNDLNILPGGEKIRGKELDLCKQFIQSIAKKFERDKRFDRSGPERGMSLTL